MPKPLPREFRDDVMAVARKGEAPISEIAKDFGISESYLPNWLAKASGTRYAAADSGWLPHACCWAGFPLSDVSL